MTRDPLTYQQARAEIARAIMREYTWRESLDLLWALPFRSPRWSDMDSSAVSLAYRIAWSLLPSGPDGCDR